LSHFLSEAAKSSILHKRHPDFGRKRPPFSAKTRKSLCIPTNRIFRKNIFELVFLKRPESGVASDEAMRKAKKAAGDPSNVDRRLLLLYSLFLFPRHRNRGYARRKHHHQRKEQNIALQAFQCTLQDLYKNTGFSGNLKNFLIFCIAGKESRK
jgi:hypothetical protein